MIHETLCYIIIEKKILLIKKKKGLGSGKYNGAGGKVGKNEPLDAAALREMLEETGVTPLNLEHCGIVAFYYGQEEKPERMVHVFKATKFSGEPANTEEADPQWFDLDKIPYSSMWPDDKIWMPVMLTGKKFMGKFYFDREMKDLKKHEIVTIDEV